MEADRHCLGPEIRSRLAANLSLTPSLKGSIVTQTDDDQSQAGQGEHLVTIREEKHGQESQEEEEEGKEVEEEEGPNTVGGGPLAFGQTSPATSARCGSKTDGHPISYKEHHVLLTRVIGNVVNKLPNSSWLFLPCLHAMADLFPCPEGMELRVPLSVYHERHSCLEVAKTLETIFPRFYRKTYPVPEKGKLVAWLDIVRTSGHFACGVWLPRDGALVALVFIYEPCVPRCSTAPAPTPVGKLYD
eukprot:jgi/Tetstr1/437965/TSEL_026595.t1